MKKILTTLQVLAGIGILGVAGESDVNVYMPISVIAKRVAVCLLLILLLEVVKRVKKKNARHRAGTRKTGNGCLGYKPIVYFNTDRGVCQQGLMNTLGIQAKGEV